jgi:hypothetical protein
VRLLILDSYKSYNSKEFKDYCRDNKIVTLCMPLYLLHLLQLLDVGCFASLKKAYRRQVEALMRSWISYVTKLKFLLAFKRAYKVVITSNNI